MRDYDDVRVGRGTVNIASGNAVVGQQIGGGRPRGVEAYPWVHAGGVMRLLAGIDPYGSGEAVYSLDGLILDAVRLIDLPEPVDMGPLIFLPY